MKTNLIRKTAAPVDKGSLRLLALSDALFATVLTLLVLDLRPPEAASAGGDVGSFISWLGPHLFSYLLTFLVAGTYWLAHHRNFDHVDQVDRGLLGYNLLFLLFIGLLPFTTAAVSGGSFRAGDFGFYWSLYAANMALAGIMLGLTWAYGISHGLVTAKTTPQQIRYIAVRQWAIPAVFLLSILVETLFPQLFPGPYTLLLIPVVSWWVDRRYAEVGPHRRPPPLSRSELLWRLGRIVPWFLILGLAVWATAL